MRVGLIIAGLVGAVVIGHAPGIIAEASADVSAECWAHLSSVDQSNTPAADRRYHLARGEHSPCTEQDANDGQGTNRNNGGDDGGKKSRHCRKHWYC